MTDGTALLATILADPADDAPRLVYADWLDEHGQPERAEFIRVQVELARRTWKDQTCKACGVRCEENKAKYCHMTFGDPDEKNSHQWQDKEKDSLRERERELSTKVHGYFRSQLPGYDPVSGASWEISYGDVVNESAWPRFHVIRGFVSEIRCTTAAFLGDDRECGHCKGSGRVGTPGVAAAVFACQPVTSVRLTDREAWVAGDGSFSGWWKMQPSDDPLVRWNLPPDLWELVAEQSDKVRAGWADFSTAALAHAALSAACVTLGRSLAGLPPLPVSSPSPSPATRA